MQETFTPTMELRFLETRGRLEFDYDRVLQQLWKGSKGTEDWRDVKIFTKQIIHTKDGGTDYCIINNS